MQKAALSFAAMIVAASSSYAAPSHAAASIKWQPTYLSAMSTAAKDHKLLMVDFYTDWCVWCKKLDADTYDAPSIVAKAHGFVPVKVNAEKEGVAQAKKYHVNGYPTILFLKPNGDVAWKIVGYMSPPDFAKQMDMAQGVTVEFPGLKQKYRFNKTDAKVDSKLMSYYSGLGDLSNVRDVLSSLDKCPQNHATEALASGYNAAGDALQAADKNAEAITAFQKAETVGTPEEMVYARISLGECYMATGDKANATRVLKALLAMGPVADTYRKPAQSMLDSVQKS